jgi:hypothetical protein
MNPLPHSLEGSTTMTFTESPVLAPYTPVTFDLYTNIHKAIRSEMFDVVLRAGRVDPSERRARIGIAARVGQVVQLLESHAEHEDAAIGPVLATHEPALAARIERDHEAFDARLDAIKELADDTVASRATAHRLYLELASFTSAYLAHQDLEERVVMPALERAVGVDAVVALNQQIVGSIPPDEMAASLAVMLPALNIDDRAELLGAMRANAPAEVFAGVWGLAGSVLASSDFSAVAARLGIAPV